MLLRVCRRMPCSTDEEVGAMRKGRDILGLPVITLSQAAKVGSVKDLAIDPGRQAVTALLLAEAGRRGPARQIPFETIRRMGPDAVLIEDESSLVTVESRPPRLTLRGGPARLMGLPVLTDAGRSAGTVSDVLVDERSGHILQYEISAGPLRDVVRGRGYITASLPRAVGRDAMIIPETAITGRRRLEEGPPLVLEAPPAQLVEIPPEEVELVAAELVLRQADLVTGKRAVKTVANEDPGGMIVFEGEPITGDAIQKAKDAGKLNQLVEAAGEAAMAALSRGLAERYAQVAVGRMAGRTVHAPDGEIIVSQGDAVTQGVVERAREAGALDQLVEAVRMPSEEMASGEAASAGTARDLWAQVGERLGYLVGRR